MVSDSTFQGRSGSSFRFSSGKRMRPGRELLYFVVASALHFEVDASA